MLSSTSEEYENVFWLYALFLYACSKEYEGLRMKGQYL
jgi:hypothetical protein